MYPSVASVTRVGEPASPAHRSCAVPPRDPADATMLWNAVLIVSAQLTTPPPPPPPPPGITCSFTPPEDPSITYDLTPLQQLGTLPAIPASSGTNSQFFISICGAPTRTCATQCSTCDVHDPAGVDTWSAPGQSCAAIGSLSTAQWMLQTPGVAVSGAMLHFEGGDMEDGTGPRRSATIVFQCDPSVAVAAGRSAVEHPPLRYTITVASAHACPHMPQPLSWGWWTIIGSIVLTVVYFGGGIAYNVRVRGEEGLDVIPQWQYWQQLPGLVKDGVVFSWTNGRVFAYNAPRELREWYNGRNTQELRAPIAAANE